MIIENITLRCIKAGEGKVLTNGKVYSSVGGKVDLGANDSVENWHEITEEEYNKLIKELELAQDEDLS